MHARLTLRRQQELRGGGAGAPVGLTVLELSLLTLARHAPRGAAAGAGAAPAENAPPAAASRAAAWGGAPPPPTPATAAEASTSESCVICLAEYAAGEELVALPCAHQFHAACGLKWLSTSSKCPLCQLDTRPLLQEVLAAIGGDALGGSGAPPPAPPNAGSAAPPPPPLRWALV
jgi:hypothetical protein